MLQFLKIYFILLILTIIRASKASCDNKMDWGPSYQICNNLQSITEVDVSNNEASYVKYLTITNSNISAINPLKLSQFRNTYILRISGQHVQKILPGAFDGLTSLRELYLSDNNLTEITTGVFNTLQALQILNLDNNKIQRIENDVFAGLLITG